MTTKKVEKILRGGDITASLKIDAEVCERCGERLYSEDIVKAFEEIRLKLKQNEFAQFQALGRSFTVNKEWPNKAIQPIA